MPEVLYIRTLRGEVNCIIDSVVSTFCGMEAINVGCAFRDLCSNSFGKEFCP